MNNINRLVFIMETAYVFCEVGTETYIRTTTGPYPEPNESNLNLLTIQCVVLHNGQYETRRCNCALVGCLLKDTVSDAGVASSYWIIMNMNCKGRGRCLS
jgi:hypothetical protein